MRTLFFIIVGIVVAVGLTLFWLGATRHDKASYNKDEQALSHAIKLNSIGLYLTWTGCIAALIYCAIELICSLLT